MRTTVFSFLTLLTACGGPKEENCPAADEVPVFADGDGDGFGGLSIGSACAAGVGEAAEAGDCDDANSEVHPERTELCNGIDDDCDTEIDQGFNQHIFYQDLDGDEYGDEATPLVACKAPSEDWTQNGGDCDDGEAAVNPGATEVCSAGIDDDCDELADEYDDSLDQTTLIGFYPDEDLDGFGAASPVTLACIAPADYLTDNTDCNDRNDLINPNGVEVCNGEVDDDCDGLRDDGDDSVDPATQIPFFADVDADGAGDPDVTVQACAPRPGIGVLNDQDCDDAQPLASPLLSEMLCDAIDNDCDVLTTDDRDLDADGFFVCVDDCDDADVDIHPGAAEVPADLVDADCDGLEDCFQDADGDGARTDVAIPVAGDARCTTAPNAPPVYPVDCDDTDAAISWSGIWWSDGDLDGFGDGVVAVEQCTDPGVGYVLEGGEIDCDDRSPLVYPGATDACNDGVDADCDATDSCSSCGTWLQSDSGLATGPYEIRPDGVTPFDVWCDMDVDGGGWTLVASSVGPPRDVALNYHADLAGVVPGAPHLGVWNGLRGLLPVNADVRFACKLAVDDVDFEVDLSFYDVPWYAEVTTGTDAQSCFSEAGSPDPVPGRRDNVAGVELAAGDPYASGALEGEDTCGDVDDFTVDFDDAGMDGDQADGTDWGSDDGKEKCGVSEAGEAWFIFARE